MEIRGTDPSANPVNTENARLSTTIDSTQVADLPLNGRNVYDLVQYVPGAVNVRGVIFEDGSQAVVNGVRENFGGFLVNGVSNKDLDGGVVNRPIVDTIQQVQVLTLNNSAEFGSSAGAVTSLVTKSRHKSTSTEAAGGSYAMTHWTPIRSCEPCRRSGQPDQTSCTPESVRDRNRGAGFEEQALLLRCVSGRALYRLPHRAKSWPNLHSFGKPWPKTFPTSVANLLYSKFTPSTTGTPAFTLRQLRRRRQILRLRIHALRGLSVPCRDWWIGRVSPSRFASLFGVEQADIDQMNMPEEDGGCPDGSPYSIPSVGALNRDDPLLVNVLNTSPIANRRRFRPG